MNVYQEKILIATPKVNGSIFRKSVIYVHTDGTAGSIGVLLNIPMDHDMAAKWSYEMDWSYPEKIYHGGPVERRLGYVIHTSDYHTETTVEINEHLSYSSGIGIIDDINDGYGPEKFVLSTGYCAWHPGQLESEVESGMWCVEDFDTEYFFAGLDRETGWDHAINLAAKNVTEKLLDTVDTA